MLNTRKVNINFNYPNYPNYPNYSNHIKKYCTCYENVLVIKFIHYHIFNHLLVVLFDHCNILLILFYW
jgi:hypothetical protein